MIIYTCNVEGFTFCLSKKALRLAESQDREPTRSVFMYPFIKLINFGLTNSFMLGLLTQLNE